MKVTLETWTKAHPMLGPQSAGLMGFTPSKAHVVT